MRPDALEHCSAKLVLESTDPQDLSSAAIRALEGGFDSQALRELAGFSGSDSVEAKELFVRALIELDRSLPTPRSAVLCLAADVSTRIRDESISPIDGARQISDLTLRAPGLTFPELSTFIYAASEWDERADDREALETGILKASLDLGRGLGDLTVLENGDQSQED